MDGSRACASENVGVLLPEGELLLLLLYAASCIAVKKIDFENKIKTKSK